MSIKTQYKRSQPSHAYQMRIELQHIEPLIWRRILVPDTLKLAKLDRVIQAAMGWTNSHLHDWQIQQRRYGVPNDEWGDSGDMRDERKFTASEVLGGQLQTLRYSYDFGDGWDASHDARDTRRRDDAEGALVEVDDELPANLELIHIGGRHAEFMYSARQPHGSFGQRRRVAHS